jgi:hypothetical protein
VCTISILISVLYFEAAGLSVRKAVIQGKGERLLRYVDKAIDEACNLVRNLGEKHKNVTRGHLLVNLVGFNVIEHTCIQCMLHTYFNTNNTLPIIMNKMEHYKPFLRFAILAPHTAVLRGALSWL